MSISIQLQFIWPIPVWRWHNYLRLKGHWKGWSHAADCSGRISPQADLQGILTNCWRHPPIWGLGRIPVLYDVISVFLSSFLLSYWPTVRTVHLIKPKRSCSLCGPNLLPVPKLVSERSKMVTVGSLLVLETTLHNCNWASCLSERVHVGSGA